MPAPIVNCGHGQHTSPLRWLPKVSNEVRPPRYAGYKELRRRARRGYAKHLAQRKKLRLVWSFARELAAAQSSEAQAAFENRFKELVARWREETKTISSTTDRALHSAYQDIIGMGKPVLPLIFREMDRNGGHWFWALRHITRENPVPPQDAGNIKNMREAWLRWGREQHYL
jgi:hypothetical protein